MDTNRRAAVIAGVLFITATVADVISRVGFLTPILGAPDTLAAVAANESRVLMGALLLLVGAVAASGIAIALYPVLRKWDHALALGSVGFRLIEGTFYLGIVVCLLILVALSAEAAQTGTAASPAYEASATLVMAARDALGQVGVLVFSLGALMYYSVFYRSRLVPRWLSAWGLLAITSVMVSGVLVIAGVFEPMSPPQLVLALPIGVQEMVLAVWLIAKGFSPVRETTLEAGLAATVTPHPTGAPAAAR
jgi:hypothetical protein